MSPRADLRPSPPRGPRWAWAAAALWVVALFTLSSWSPGGGALDFFWRFPHDDKVVHAGLYAVLGALVVSLVSWFLGANRRDSRRDA